MEQTDFQLERQRRREARAARLRGKADAAFEDVHQHGRNGPPMGEPIKVGHHSERRHRKHFDVMDRKMGNAVELSRAAETAACTADRKVTEISSDDPDAVPALEARIARLREKQGGMKRVNAAYRAFKKKPESLEASGLSDAEKELVRTWQPTYGYEKAPVPAYELQNNLANIKRLEGRLAELKVVSTRVDVEREVGGVRIVANAEANRLQLFFPGKPENDIRSELKRQAFRWAPSVGAWQRQLNRNAVYAMTQVISWDFKDALSVLLPEPATKEHTGEEN